MKTALVTTTIHVPEAIDGYLTNFAKYGHRDVDVVVIGDHKSPAETGDYLAGLAERTGYTIHWWDVDRQKEWLKDLPELDALLPYNSVQRRNLAYLQAVLGGAERIITVDDDNHATDDDFIGGHEVVGQRAAVPVSSSSSGWYNSGSLLKTEPHKPLYHRGFPVCMRGLNEEITQSEAEGRVVVNAGLWLGVPDACAMSHLDIPVEVTGYRDGFDGRVGVAPGTNMVFNSQNTAFHRDLLAAMYLMPMGGKVGPLEVGRYDDIWMGIFVKVIADHLGDLVTVGRPLVRQLRNEHDLVRDMLWEAPAIRITNTMTKTLQSVRLTASDWTSCYRELIDQLRAGLSRDGYAADEVTYLTGMYDGMETWAGIAEGFSAAAGRS